MEANKITYSCWTQCAKCSNKAYIESAVAITENGAIRELRKNGWKLKIQDKGRDRNRFWLCPVHVKAEAQAEDKKSSPAS